MVPYLFKIGHYPVYGYSAMMVVAIIVGFTAALIQAKREGFDLKLMIEGSIITIIMGYIGARALYVFLNWDFYSTRPERIFLPRFTGLSYYGTFILGTLTAFVWSRLRKQNFGKIADLWCPYLILGYAIVRIGCFLSGCCYGKPSGVYWAVVVPRVDNLFRHPVQLYASFGAFLIFIFLRAMHHRRPFDGFNLVALGSLYGLLRFITEFFREADSHMVFLGLSAAQLFSLPLFLFSTALLLHLTRRAKEDEKKALSSKGKRRKSKK